MLGLGIQKGWCASGAYPRGRGGGGIQEGGRWVCIIGLLTLPLPPDLGYLPTPILTPNGCHQSTHG